MKREKKIVLCLDGTFNQTIRPRDDSVLIRPGTEKRMERIREYFKDRYWTNVAKIRYLIAEVNKADRKIQITSYFNGVGAGRSGLDRGMRGATGVGIDDQILEAYQFLSDNYVPGDEIFLIGYSRGAVAATALASMIETSGLLRGAHAGPVALKTAWNHYFRGLTKDLRRKRQNKTDYWAENGKNVFRNVRIKALALWDSVIGGEIEVSSGRYLASPIRGAFKVDTFASLFRQTVVPSTVDSVFHAVAIDEFRELFKPVLFEGLRHGEGEEELPTVEQVWLPGSHGNVGGGCYDKGLSDISLSWMIRKLKSKGLSFHSENVSDKVKPDANGAIFDSLRADYTGIPPYGFGRKSIRTIGSGAVLGEKVHSSVAALWSAKVRITRQDPTEKRPLKRIAYPLVDGADRWNNANGQMPFKASVVEDGADYETYYGQLGKNAGTKATEFIAAPKPTGKAAGRAKVKGIRKRSRSTQARNK